MNLLAENGDMKVAVDVPLEQGVDKLVAYHPISDDDHLPKSSSRAFCGA